MTPIQYQRVNETSAPSASQGAQQPYKLEYKITRPLYITRGKVWPPVIHPSKHPMYELQEVKQLINIKPVDGVPCLCTEEQAMVRSMVSTAVSQ